MILSIGILAEQFRNELVDTVLYSRIEGFLGRFKIGEQAVKISFDPVEQNVQSIHDLIYSSRVTCRDVVQGYLERIEAVNPEINSIITLSNTSLDTADSFDQALRQKVINRAKMPLFCIPVLLKENFDTSDMPTTAGSISLEHLMPVLHAPVVTRLKQAGAIILGKANMHEFALEGFSVSSLGGQTYNLYDLTRTPGGSSGGSGAAVAASLCTFATGSDTVKSIRSPAASNSLYGMRPTRGLISRTGIIPVSHTQDTIGPIARTVADLAVAFEIMVGQPSYDMKDDLTIAGIDKRPTIPYHHALNNQALRGARIGVWRTMLGNGLDNETLSVNKAIQHVLDSMTKSGATVLNITDLVLDSTQLLNEYDVQDYEFMESLN